MRRAVRLGRQIVCVLICSLFAVPSIVDAAITTTSEIVGEDVVWSISGVSDSKIHFDSRLNLNDVTEIVYYTAPLPMGNTIAVHAEIPHARELTSGLDASRKFLISIPDAGTRWVAEKAWNDDDGPPPTSVTLEHQARFSPYQVVPPYPDNRHQPDKNIQITDITFTFEEGQKNLIIYIKPHALVGIDNPENNGLPKHAKTEPDYTRKKPKGCNGCSDMGLPGYRVNMGTLKPVIQDILYQWTGRGPAVELALTWNSGLSGGATNFGQGWRFSYDAWLTEFSDGVIVHLDSGEQLHFTIPAEANGNVTSVTGPEGNREVKLHYVGPAGEPLYNDTWDGRFETERSGYILRKTIGGDPALRTFSLTPPDSRLSFIFQGTSAHYEALPLIAVEDWSGNRLHITRNGSGAITAITDAVGRTASLAYNAGGQCTSITLPGGSHLTFFYTGINLTRAIDLIGNQTDYSYSATKNIKEMKTGTSLWRFDWTTFEDVEYLNSVTDPEGHVTSYDLLVPDFANRKTRINDPSGRSFVYEYPDGQYRRNDSQQSPDVISDTLGRPVEITKKGGSSKRLLAYNSEGNLSQVTEYDDGVHSYTYNSRGLPTSYVDALNNTWLIEYDDYGNVTRNQTPAGRVFQYAYNAYGELVQATDGGGRITNLSYDDFGNVKTITDPEGSVTTLGYSATGIDLTSVTDALGNTNTFTYDANRRLTRRTNADNTFQETLYDCCAAIGLRNENGAQRTITRSPSLKILRETDFLGNAMTYTYDEAGRQVQSRDALGRKTDTSYNDLGQPTAVCNALGQTMNFDYYSNTDELFQHTLAQQPPAQAETSMSWRGVAAKANGWEFVRDRMGRLKSIITPRDYWKRINFSRDADGLLTGKDWNGSEVIGAYARDGNGRLLSATHPLGTDSYQRNGRGQVTRQTWYDTKEANFTFDTAGRLATLTYPDGSTAVYTYDVRGRITSVSWKGSVITTSYDAVGNITGEIRTNGISTELHSDANSQPLAIRHYRGTKNLFDLQCTRNTRGFIDGCTEASEAYNHFPELTAESTSSTYRYDRSFTINTRNGEAATTDPNGNQLTIPGPRGFSGTYDYRNLLKSWNTAGSANGAVYDGRDRLIRWTRDGDIRNFHYDEHDRLLFETDGSDNLTAMWLYRGGQVVAMATSSAVFFYHTDLKGNIALLSDEAGELITIYHYLPFGLKTVSGGNVGNPFTYVGAFGVIDLEEGLYYMRSRTYDALTRAFLSNDPIGMGVTANAREYARNNPVNWIDPDGRFGFLTQYSAEGAVGPRVGADFDNKVYNEPTMRYEQPRGQHDPCMIGTAWNVATSNKYYGNAAGVGQILIKLANGEYGDAAYDTAGLAAGLASPVAGMWSTFMGASPLVDSASERAEMEKLMNDPNSFYNKNKRDFSDKYNVPKPNPYEFTLPPFSLDE